MIGIVVITHGSLASGLMEAAEMILGRQEMVKAITFSRSEGREDLISRVTAALQGMGEANGILILTDMKGGSAYNVGRALMGDYDAWLITGANLPVLLEVLLLRKEINDLKEIASVVVKKGQDGMAHMGN